MYEFCVCVCVCSPSFLPSFLHPSFLSFTPCCLLSSPFFLVRDFSACVSVCVHLPSFLPSFLHSILPLLSFPSFPEPKQSRVEGTDTTITTTITTHITTSTKRPTASRTHQNERDRGCRGDTYDETTARTTVITQRQHSGLDRWRSLRLTNYPHLNLFFRLRLILPLNRIQKSYRKTQMVDERRIA